MFLAAALAVAWPLRPAASQELIGPAGTIEGTARVIDGDTLEIRRHPIRLRGVDAPELDQPCDLAPRPPPAGTFKNAGTIRAWMRTLRGPQPITEPWFPGREAKAWLHSMVAGRTVTCHVTGTDAFGRAVATCYVGGRNINRALVAAGWAFARAKYSRRYLDDEKAARAEHRGMWAGTCDRPWRWRAKVRRQGSGIRDQGSEKSA